MAYAYGDILAALGLEPDAQPQDQDSRQMLLRELCDMHRSAEQGAASAKLPTALRRNMAQLATLVDLDETSALSILQKFAASVDGDAYVIPAPAIVDTADIAQAIKKDSQIQNIMQMAQSCQTAIYSAGAFGRPSVIFEMGIIDDVQYAKMAADGCVGDCCGHFLNADGGLFDEDLDRRVVGVALDTIRQIPNRLLIASDPRKGKVLRAALKGGLASHLYADVKTAEAILK